jgi:hypothetical protein
MPQFTGVAKGQVAKGSKSEREAVCLETGRKRYILRRKEGNAVHDEELEKLIRAGGSVIGGGIILMPERSEATG